MLAVDRVATPRSEIIDDRFSSTPYIEIMLLSAFKTNVELIGRISLQLRVRRSHIKFTHNSQAA